LGEKKEKKRKHWLGEVSVFFFFFFIFFLFLFLKISEVGREVG
jgi:hypothetical protein